MGFKGDIGDRGLGKQGSMFVDLVRLFLVLGGLQVKRVSAHVLGF